jgi:hypothetical protein
VLEGNTAPSLRSYTTPLDYSYYYSYNISSFLSDAKVLGVFTIKASIQSVMG